MGLFDSKRSFSNLGNTSSGSSSSTEKQVVWQCRYCGIKNTRWQSNGMPDPGFCNRNGKMGGPKGPHRWMKIMTK